MVRQDFILNRADWRIIVYHSASKMWVDEIIDDLIGIGCKGEKLKDAENSLWRNEKNSGFTFSNCSIRSTVIVIFETSSGAEYWNSIDHEKLHLLQDISITDSINPYGEEISYISGELLRELYKDAKRFLCDCCREKQYRRLL